MAAVSYDFNRLTITTSKKRCVGTAVATSVVPRRTGANSIGRVLPAISLLTACACIVGVSIRTFEVGAAANALVATSPLISVRVQPGDTAWKLAQEYGNHDQYILDRIDAIYTANGLPEDSVLHAGQLLQIRVTNPALVASIRAHKTLLASAR